MGGIIIELRELMKYARLLIIICSVGIFLTIGIPASGQQTGTITRITTASSRTTGGFYPIISKNGQFVVFSTSTALTPEDTDNGMPDLYWYDRQTSTLVLVTVEAVAVTNYDYYYDYYGYTYDISADGRFVAFSTYLNGMVIDDTNNRYDVFVRDMQLNTTQRISLSDVGAQLTSDSYNPQLSADGRFVVFSSTANNLVANDTNNSEDIFMFDRQTSTITRITLNSQGVEGTGGYSYLNAVSADGRFVQFFSTMTNLVPNDTNNTEDVFVRDTLLNTTTRASLDSSGNQVMGISMGGGVSNDGRYVSFSSTANNLVAGDINNAEDVFVRDMQTGIVTRVSVDSAGTQANSWSWFMDMTDDGRYITYISYADNLVAGDTNYMADVFRHDNITGETIRISVNSAGEQGDSHSDRGLNNISNDGMVIVFASLSQNLVPEDYNDTYDVFVRDLNTNTTQAISLYSSLTQIAPNSSSYNPSISDDGQFVVYESSAQNLTTDLNNFETNIFLYDRQTATTTRISTGINNTPANLSSYNPVISGDGNTILFASAAYNLIENDTNNATDLFMYNRLTGVISRLPLDPLGAKLSSGSASYDISTTGRYVAFASSSDVLVPDDTNNASDIFIYDTLLGTISRASVNHLSEQANGGSFYPSIAQNGDIAFQSSATNLVANDTNNANDIFLYEHINRRVDIRISEGAGGIQATASSSVPHISGSGNTIIFSSSASNLVTGDTNSRSDAFIYTRSNDRLARISVNNNGMQLSDNSYAVNISYDGQYALFYSYSKIVPEDTDTSYDLYRYNTVSEYITWVSTQESFTSHNVPASLSGDGMIVTFSAHLPMMGYYPYNYAYPYYLYYPYYPYYPYPYYPYYPYPYYPYSPYYQFSGAPNIFVHEMSILPILVAPELIDPINSEIIYTAPIIMSWNTVSTATSYQLQVSTTNDFSSLLYNITTTNTSYTLPPNLPNTYYWRVRAKNEYGYGLWSSIRYFTQAYTPPELEAPNLIAPVDDAELISGSVTFSWDAISGVTQYELQISTSGDFSTYHTNIVISTNTSTRSFSTSGLYYWRVRTKVGSLNGAWSIVRSFNLGLLPAPVLTAPSNGTGSYLNTYFRWNAVTGATGYQIQFSTTNTFTSPVTYTNTSTSRQVNLSPAGLYYWRVRATNGSLQGLWSEVRTFTSVQLPAPTVYEPPLNFVSYSPYLAFQWNGSGTSSRVQISTHSDFSTLLVNAYVSDTGTSSYAYFLTQPGIYYWRIREFGAAGDGIWSETGSYEFYDTLSPTTQILYDANPDLMRTGQTIQPPQQSTTSDDGRYVTFLKTVGNIAQAFVYDRQTGNLTLESVSSTGDIANSAISATSITTDGRYVFFATLANNLVADDTNNMPDVFRHDRQTGETIRISVGNNGEQGILPSNTSATLTRFAITPDGRFVAFSSYANNWEANDTTAEDIFLRDTYLNTLRRIPVGDVQSISMSDSSQDIVFITSAVLSSSDANANPNIYIYDTFANQYYYFSTVQPPDSYPTISGDGRYLLHSRTYLGKILVVVYDRIGGEIISISHGYQIKFDNNSSHAVMSRDGRYVVFTSAGTAVVKGDTNAVGDVFLYDIPQQAIQRISVNSDGVQGNAESFYGYAIIPATNEVIFTSSATNLIATDENNATDMFVYRFFPTPMSQQIAISEQELMVAMQSHLTEPFQYIVIDMQPFGIFTTVQFTDGIVATTMIRLDTTDSIMSFSLNELTIPGGTQTHIDALYHQLPVLIMDMLDDVVPSDYASLSGAYLTNNGMVIGFRED